MGRSDKFGFIRAASEMSLSELYRISEAQEEIWAEKINVEVARIYTVTEASGENRTPKMKSLGKPVFKSRVKVGEPDKEDKERGQSSSWKTRGVGIGRKGRQKVGFQEGVIRSGKKIEGRKMTPGLSNTEVAGELG